MSAFDQCWEEIKEELDIDDEKAECKMAARMAWDRASDIIIRAIHSRLHEMEKQLEAAGNQPARPTRNTTQVGIPSKPCGAEKGE